MKNAWIGLVLTVFCQGRVHGDDIHRAIEKGDLAAVRRLVLANKAVLRAKHENGLYPLHMAVSRGNREITKLLLDQGAAPSAQTDDGLTALHWAAIRGYVDLAKLLLARGAAVNAEDLAGKSPLHVAALFGHADVVELLIAKGADVSALTRRPTEGAFMDSPGKGAKKWLDSIPFGTGYRSRGKVFTGRTPLHMAAAGGSRGSKAGERARIIALLIAKGADVNAKDSEGNTPLDLALEAKSAATAKALVQRGAESPKHPRKAEMAALFDDAAFKELVNQTLQGHAEQVKKLLDAHPRLVNRAGSASNTLLHYAARLGHASIAEILLAKGAEVNKTLRWGDTPLHVAAQNGRTAVAKLLITQGADVNARNNNGWTPLHLAAFAGRRSIPMAELLLAHGAQINAPENKGLTPLDVARKHRKQGMYAFLAKSGGKPGVEPQRH